MVSSLCRLQTLGYVFELLIAHIDKVQINLAVDLLEQCAGEVNTAPFGDFLKARRDVYTVTVNIVPLDDHFSKVNANAEGKHSIVRHSGIAHSHALLNCDGAFDGVDSACELDEQAITHQLHETPVAFGNRRIDQFGTMGLQRTKRSCSAKKPRQIARGQIEGGHPPPPPLCGAVDLSSLPRTHSIFFKI